MFSVENQPMFRKNTSTPSSELNNISGKEPAWNKDKCFPLHAGFLVGLIINPEDGIVDLQ
jgi:hypothetical protein